MTERRQITLWKIIFSESFFVTELSELYTMGLHHMCENKNSGIYSFSITFFFQKDYLASSSVRLLERSKASSSVLSLVINSALLSVPSSGLV